MEQNFLTKSKLTLAMLFFIASLSMQAQESNILFPRNISFINPAYSGLESDIDISSQLSWPSSNLRWGGYNPLLFNADFKIDGINSGIGINVFTDRAASFASRDSLESYNFSEAYQGNYNYQIDLNGSTLSLGVMAQYKRRNWNNAISIPAKGFKDTWLFGAGAVWKINNLTVGASVLQADRLPEYKDSGSSLKQMDVQVHAKYKINVGEKWHITPSILYANTNSGSNNMIAIDANVGAGDFFYFGGNLYTSGSYVDISGVYAGITILKRLQFEYRLSYYITSGAVSNNLMHGVGLRYFIEHEK